MRAERRAFAVVAAVLGVCYAGTLAPGVTLWDAGEFASSVATFGIPHPPGTPLYVMLGRAFTLALAWLPVARATSLFSALCTIGACATLAALVSRWTGRMLDGVAAGCLAGLMSSVWFNANETEVYAASLLLSALMLFAADAARARDDERGTILVAYTFALTVPLHLSALVAAPAAVALASVHRDAAGRPRLDRVRAVALTGAMLIAAGAGLVSGWPLLAGLAFLLAAIAVAPSNARRSRLRLVVGIAAVLAVGLSAVTVMMLRAGFDPGINQGNPVSLGALLDVIARRQYAVPGLWPRRAPLWLQLANMFQYADWQAGLALAPNAVGAAWTRTPVTVALVVLGAVGTRVHRQDDAVSWWGVLVLIGAATVGVAVYLNLRAGPSIGYGILPPDAEHEARERDYFFALGFAAWGLWAGVGLSSLARRLASARASFLVAGAITLLAAGNWHAVDRSRPPNSHLADRFARALLESSPPRAVLLVAGDNDTYPVWYLQRGERLRPDVTPVTLPLLPADWYRAELARRDRLGDSPVTRRWRGERATVREIAERAAALGRPLAATVSVEPETRSAIDGEWVLEGMVYVRRAASTGTSASSGVGHADDRRMVGVRSVGSTGSRVSIDSAAVNRAAALVERLIPGPLAPADFPDPAARYVASLLDCPRRAMAVVSVGDSASRALLASRCNFR